MAGYPGNTTFDALKSNQGSQTSSIQLLWILQKAKGLVDVMPLNGAASELCLLIPLHRRSHVPF